MFYAIINNATKSVISLHLIEADAKKLANSLNIFCEYSVISITDSKLLSTFNDLTNDIEGALS